MQYMYVDSGAKYDGSQLRSLYSYLNHQVLGDSIVAWVGECDIPTENIVDGEDLLQGSQIRGNQMLHFIVEKFHTPLFAGVVLQRLLATMVRDFIIEKGAAKPEQTQRLGDDIFIDGGKLNISIATQSPTSTLIHFAINVTNEGTPVKTSALEDLGLDSREFADEIGNRFSEEVTSMENASMKVRWVE